MECLLSGHDFGRTDRLHVGADVCANARPGGDRSEWSDLSLDRNFRPPHRFFAFGPKSVPTDRVWFLHKLYVSPEYQGQGGGQAALEFICRKLDGEGAERLQLRVNRGNLQAIRAYEKYGFERVGECCADIGGGFVMDDYVMECAVAGDF